MSDLNQKLTRFTAAILAEANADTERTLAQLSEKRTAAYDQAETEVLSEAYHYIHDQVGRVRTQAGRQVSRHMLDNKRTLYLRRETISQEVFGEVRRRLEAYTAGPGYRERMAAIYAEALHTLSGAAEARVYLRPADMPLAAALASGQPQVKAEFLEGDFTVGGLIAEAPALGRRVDATFDSTLEELSGHFAELFGLSLSGELDEEVHP